jgi:hypothetical protein
MSDFSGYHLGNDEDMDLLKSIPGESSLLLMRGTYQEVRLDPREVIVVEDQGSQGACAGHSLSSILEWIYTVLSGQTGMALSRAMAYYEAQRLSNIRGDSGSTISAGVKLAKTVGLCQESLWRYPSRYNPERPQNYQAVLEDAAKFRIGSETKIQTYDGYRTFVGAGIGGVHNGISWGDYMNVKVVEDFTPGSRDGGHSIAGLALSTRLDKDGNPYIWILNSWRRTWGQNGWQEWSPKAIRKMLQHQFTAMVGLSDMPFQEFKPREYTLDDLKKGLAI